MQNKAQYPNYNQQNLYTGQDYNNPNYTNTYGGNNSPNHANANGGSNNNNQNNQAMNMAPNFINQASMGMRHGGQENLHEGQYYNKDLNNSLQGNARAQFIRKVYSLLSLQLFVTIIIGIYAYNVPLFKVLFANIPMLIILTILLFAFSCVIGCFTETFRKCALPIFIGFTVVMSILVGISICAYNSKVVLMAAGITFILVLALSAYAWISKSDFTTFMPYLVVIGFVLCIFGVVSMFWRDPLVQLIYSCLSALLFCIYLVADTQMILGRGTYSYGLDDAYLAAIQIYIDIIQLFLHLLSIIAHFDK